MLGMGLLVWPLLVVTGQPRLASSRAVNDVESEDVLLTDVTVRSAHPFLWMELRSGGAVVERLEGPTREGEFECELSADGELLMVVVSFPPETPETALKLQFWSGSFPEKEFTFWGEGELVEEIEIQFHE